MGLRIGVNALYLLPGQVGGTEIYLRHLVAALGAGDHENEYFVFTNAETGEDLVPRQPNFWNVPQDFHAANRPVRILWEQTEIPAAAHRLRLNVLFNPGFTGPALCSCPQVTMFHDLQHKRHPEYFRWFDLPFWRLCLWSSAKRSRLLLVPSEATRADLLHYYRVPEKKIRVIPEGVDPAFFEIGRERQGLTPEPYILCVSTSHPHKGLVPLIQAFAQVHRARPEFRLVSAGVRGFHAEAVEQAVKAAGLQGAVRFTGWLPRADLYDLYRHAFAFVYPSTFEGFGLPVLEALAAGVPAACSAIEPLSGIAGDGALKFEPGNTGAVACALLRLISEDNLRARLSAAGPLHARRFSWEAAAQATLAAFHEAVQSTARC